MRALVVAAPRTARIEQAPIPEPREGEVLLRVDGCGVCGSSMPLWEGRPWFEYPLGPGEPGHEPWGVVADAGGVDTGLVGRRVAALSGRSLAEYDVARVDELVVLPPELGRVPFPGEALGSAVNVFRRSGVQPGSTVAIVGIGFLGALLVQLAVHAGATVLAFSRREFARAVARRFGAETPLPGEVEDASCDVAIEVAGVQDTLDLAARLVRVRGRLVVAGYHQDGARSVDLQSWNWRGLDVVNAHERDPQVYVEGIRRAADLVVAGVLDPEPLYTPFPLDQAGDAFDAALTRPDGFVKAVVMAA